MSNRQPNTDEPIATDAQPEETSTIQIPTRIGTKIQMRTEGTEFGSVDEYVTFVLESVLRQLEVQDDDGFVDRTDTRETEPEDSEAIQERLESLGYL